MRQQNLFNYNETYRTTYMIYFSNGREVKYMGNDEFQEAIDRHIRLKDSFIAKNYKKRVFWLVKKGRCIIDKKIF